MSETTERSLTDTGRLKKMLLPEALKSPRDAEILNLHRNGTDMGELAQQFGLSAGHVRRIIKREEQRLKSGVNRFGLSTRAYNALYHHLRATAISSITIDKIAAVEYGSLCRERGVGRKIAAEVLNMLRERGIEMRGVPQDSSPADSDCMKKSQASAQMCLWDIW
jgi:hypothetical protein